MSAELSAAVPRKRCSGLMHGGLSQWWQTYIFGGTGLPWKSSQATRWALVRIPPELTRPYPLAFLPRVHSMHPLAVGRPKESISSSVYGAPLGRRPRMGDPARRTRS